MLWIILAIAILLWVIVAGAIGVATSFNRRYPENARFEDHLWIFVVIIGLLPVAIAMVLFGS